MNQIVFIIRTNVGNSFRVPAPDALAACLTVRAFLRPCESVRSIKRAPHTVPESTAARAAAIS